MAVKVVLDTNAILYILSGRALLLAPNCYYCVSVISEIELLSYWNIAKEEEDRIRTFLSTVNLLGLSSSIRRAAIHLRQTSRLRVPDAIIVGSALVLDAELWTNDAKLLQIPGIQARSLPPLGS